MAPPHRPGHRRIPATAPGRTPRSCPFAGAAAPGSARCRPAGRRKPAQLSGGEQQRVGLARAMARQAALYLFDEPTAHLDAQVRDVFLAELAARRRESGAAAIYATHDAAEALGLADRVALLIGGRVIQVGTPQQVYAQPINAAAARLTGPVSLLAGSDVSVLVRPDWAKLGGDRTGVVADVWFRGSHTDYVLDTPDGQLHLRASRGSRLTEEARRSAGRWTIPGRCQAISHRARRPGRRAGCRR